MITDNKKEEQNNKSSQSPVETAVESKEETTQSAKALDKTETKETTQSAKALDKTETKETAQSAKALDKTETKETTQSVEAVKKAPASVENNAQSEEKAPVQADTEKQNEKSVNEAKKTTNKEAVKLNGLFAFKMSMSTFYSEKGESFPVTALKYEPCLVSQIKTKEKESYSAVQVAFKAQKNKRCSKALIQHLVPAGFKEGARFVKEIRQTPPEGIKLGQELSIESVKKGDLVKISALSKGRGFAGVMKRWNFAGGKASHGSKAHRRTGSIGQHTEPARVFPGRKMPGRYGFQKVSRSKVSVVDVLAEEGIIFIKGPVPGARNTLVSIQKM